MKRNYLKIGELANLKGISVKSLRYYDKIGALKPVYVNENTGYRYYAPEQLIVLDIINLCITFNLPLKSLNGYCEGNSSSLDLKNLILDGQQQAEKKIHEAEKTLRLSKDILEQIERLDNPHNENEIYYSDFKERNVLTAVWNEKTDTAGAYMDKIAVLHETARKNDLTILTQQGLLLNHITKTKYVFLAVEGKSDFENSVTLPSGKYCCTIMDEASLNDIPFFLNEKGIKSEFSVCLNTDIYDYCLEHHLHRLEVQTKIS